MKYLINLFVLISLFGCNSKINSNSEDICSNLDLSKARVGNISFVSTYDAIVEKLGKPTTRIDSCATTGILYKQGFKNYSCLEFKNMPGLVFKLYQDTIFIYSIDFSKVNKPIYLGGNLLSESFSMDLLADNCEKLDEILNKGASLDAILKKQDYVPIVESKTNSRKPEKNKVELIYENKKLVNLYLDWRPSYTKLEWINYLKVKNELELRK